MSNPDPLPRLHRRRAPSGFRPRFAIGLLYLLAFFFLSGLLMVLPELMDVLDKIPPGPRQQEIAEEVTREAIGRKVYLAFLAALVVTALGGYFKVLPGLGPRV